MKKGKKDSKIVLLVIAISIIIIVGIYFLLTNKNNSNEKKEIKNYILAFEKDYYYCHEGTTIDVNLIFADNDQIKEYLSDDESIATIVKNSKDESTCSNCEIAQITCNKEGKTTLHAISNKGNKVTIELVVFMRDFTSITFEKEQYSCNVGEVIPTMISTAGNDGPDGYYYTDGVYSFSSSNNDIAEITERVDETLECNECVAIDIKCKSKGEATLTTKSEYGAIMHVPVWVN